MSSINIKYFASLREKRGLDSEVLSFTGTYKELYETLSNRHHFDLPVEIIQLAVNDEFSSMDEIVRDGSKVVFIPPVAGG